MLTDVPFYWEFVPTDSPSEWTEHMVEFFDKWAGRTLATAQSAWTAGDFPFTAENVGRETARLLLAKAAELPDHARLAWGTSFHDGQVRWSPIPLVAEFHQPLDDDP